MNKAFCFIVALTPLVTFAFDTPADTTLSVVNVINASGTISITQSQALKQYVACPEVPVGDNETESVSTPQNTRNGYRVLVFDDNNPQTAHSAARNREAAFQQQFPQWRAYVSFNSPYWQVKVGDFRSRAEAEAAMAEIRELHPSLGAYMRIVRERINIID